MSAAVEDHTPEAHDVITCELVACTLGQRRHADRLDLRVDVAGQMARIGRNLAAMQVEIGRRIVEAMAPALADLARRLR
jgi:hypothetical protein